MSFQRGPSPPEGIDLKRRKHFFAWSSRRRRAGNPYSWHEFLAFEASKQEPPPEDPEYETWRLARVKESRPNSRELFESVYREKGIEMGRMDMPAKTNKTETAQKLLAERRLEVKIRRINEKAVGPKRSAYHIAVEEDRRAYLERLARGTAS